MERDGTQRGRVIDIKTIWWPVQLVLVFGERCPPDWTSDTAIDLATELYINCFMSKFTYYSMI